MYRDGLSQFVRAASAITGDEGLGREAVQEAFASAVKRRGSFRREVPLEAWVWRIVVNAALSLRRSMPREEPLPDALEIPAVRDAALEQDALVREWVAGLPERQRLVVFLRYFAGLDYRAIAGALEIEVGTVSATLSSAHAALRRSIREGVPQ